MRKLLTILYVVLAIKVFVITSSAVIGQFSPHQKPMLGLQIDPTHPLGNGKGGLVDAWFFNEGSGNKVFDLSGNGNTGTLEGNTLWVPGKFGSCLDFNGAGAYVDVPDNDIAENIPALTVSTWIKPNIANAGNMAIVTDENNGPDVFILYRSEDEQYSFVVFNSSTSSLAVANAIYADTIWHHVVGVYNGTNVQVYVDGVAGDSTPPALTGNTNTGTTGIEIGAARQQSGTYGYWNGLIDQVLIYNRGLSASEIAELYREPFGMFVKDDIALLAVAVEPPPPPSGQVITIIMTSIPLFLIPFFFIRRSKRGK